MSTISSSTTSTTAYKVTADTTGTLVLQTGATPTTAVTIDTSQNVGVGTSSPSQKFEVAGNVLLSNNQYFGVKDTTGAAVGFPIYTGSNDAIFGYLASGTTGISTYQFRTGNNVERMRIDSSGNVMMGTTTSNSLRLTVDSGAANFGTAQIKGSGTLPDNNDNSVLYVSHSGTAGTGLRVRTDQALTGTNFAHVLVNNASASINGLQVSQYGTGWIANFDKSGTSALFINNSGNVGIGTTSPGQKLEVNNGAADVTVLAKATGANYASFRVTNSSKDYSMQIRTDQTNAWVLRDETSSANRIIVRASDGVLFVPSVYATTNAAAANVYVGSDGSIVRSTSSLKYKKDVQDATHGLADVLKLRSVTYKGKAESNGDTVFGGFIAEEIDALGLTEFVQYADDGSPDALAYGNMVSLLAKAIQEQQALIQQLQADVAALKGVSA